MSTQSDIKLTKWPFFVADAVLLAFGCFLYLRHEGSPFTSVESILFLCAGIAGATLAVTPFLLEYLAAVRMLESSAIVSTVAQIQNLESIAGQISGATAQWQGVQEHANRAAKGAQDIAARMSAETAAFTEFLKKANDSERATLRLELEKLRRAETEWLQIVVRMLDHTYALHQAAIRSGQTNLIQQLGQFQHSCRELARRIGLVPFAPAADDPFDSKLHETPEAQEVPAADSRVRETIATGYNYQGRMIRPALVSLHNGSTPVPETSSVEPVLQPDVASPKPEIIAEEGTLL